jgi:hypothetical protein
MKVELLCLGAANKPSPISEGVAEIRINSQHCKGINLTTRHTEARRAQRVTTVHDAVKEKIRPGGRMPRWTHRGWHMHYPIIHPLGMVG